MTVEPGAGGSGHPHDTTTATKVGLVLDGTLDSDGTYYEMRASDAVTIRGSRPDDS